MTRVAIAGARAGAAPDTGPGQGDQAGALPACIMSCACRKSTVASLVGQGGFRYHSPSLYLPIP